MIDKYEENKIAWAKFTIFFIYLFIFILNF